jgi:hypothetical protein
MCYFCLQPLRRLDLVTVLEFCQKSKPSLPALNRRSAGVCGGQSVVRNCREIERRKRRLFLRRA